MPPIMHVQAKTLRDKCNKKESSPLLYSGSFWRIYIVKHDTHIFIMAHASRGGEKEKDKRLRELGRQNMEGEWFESMSGSV